jgi:hypothetical protein
MNEPTLEPGQETLLDLKLDGLRFALGAEHAPDQEAALLRAFREHRAKPARPRLWWLPPLALVATLAVVSWIVRHPAAPSPVQAPSADRDDSPFLALRPLERIALEPRTTVVETQFPRALLADWGLPVAPDRAGEPVRAEMLYSADGEPLAVRLLN